VISLDIYFFLDNDDHDHRNVEMRYAFFYYVWLLTKRFVFGSFWEHALRNPNKLYIFGFSSMRSTKRYHIIKWINVLHFLPDTWIPGIFSTVPVPDTWIFSSINVLIKRHQNRMSKWIKNNLLSVFTFQLWNEHCQRSLFWNWIFIRWRFRSLSPTIYRWIQSRNNDTPSKRRGRPPKKQMPRLIDDNELSIQKATEEAFDSKTSAKSRTIQRRKSDLSVLSNSSGSSAASTANIEAVARLRANMQKIPATFGSNEKEVRVTRSKLRSVMCNCFFFLVKSITKYITKDFNFAQLHGSYTIWPLTTRFDHWRGSIVPK